MGVIVNVTSLSGKVSSPLAGYYAATKFALEAISEALHYEVSHFGIRVRHHRTRRDRHQLRRRNEHQHGDDVPPYDELRKQWDVARILVARGSGHARSRAGRVGHRRRDRRPGHAVACACRCRRRDGHRGTASMDDAAFEAAMRQTLGLEW